MENRIRWTGYEFEYKNKTEDWFWAVSIIIVCISIISFIYDNAIFGIFILLSGITVLMNAKKPPRLLDYELTNKGIMINEKVYPHEDFRNFWVQNDKFGPPKLLLRTNKVMTPIIVITIETDYVNTDAVRDFLLDYIPEEKIDESLSIKFMEYLGF